MPNNRTIYDKGKVTIGLLIFIAIVTFPFWYNLGKAVPAPKPILTDKAKEAKVCVRSTDYMRTEHMQLLDVWRDTVVRDGKRVYLNEQGTPFNMSLSNTCLDCHSNKADFCDKCHTYASVVPYCWQCHIENPKETE